ncbi:PfkB family carbohydrate kinase [Rugosimonospora africana]|uniref:PfkB family carbohydrate kinase n=1 Tax=Rugosimonospora africana TaxID=556532 RepID=UPI001EF286FA|nr:PfkB family carbohydrate kinase [Rugosimonospora africana]
MTRPIVVVGDALLDRDVVGQVDRICPDAPAPVFEESQAFDRPGGAALAAALLAEYGRPVRLVAAIGADPAGDRLRELLESAGVEVVALPYRGSTPEKIRLCAGPQVLMRMDRGSPGQPLDPDGGLDVAFADAGAIVVSDYGRGVAGLASVRAAVAASTVLRPVVWDPHPRGPAPVPGVRLVTPNESEVLATAGNSARGNLAGGNPHDAGTGGGRHRAPDAPDTGPDGSGSTGFGHRFSTLAVAANRARERWRVRAVTVTLGADGALLAHGGATPMVVPAPVRADADSCGAGDRFAGAAAAALADGSLLSEAVQSAVADAATFVAAGAARGYARRSTGAVPRSATEVSVEAALAMAAATRGAGGTVVATGGCFDLLHAGHVATLEAARALGDCLIVCLNSDHSVRSLKGPDRPLVSQDDRARLVAALGCVDVVAVFDELTPEPLLARLRPDVWVKGGDYFLDDPDDRPVLPEAELIRSWGGQSVVVPYLANHSTSGLIRSAQDRLTPPPAEPRREGEER